MSSRPTPRAATWLLQRLGGGSRLEPLIGDLLEQFEEGRSRFWYWRQAAGALAIELAQTLRLHALSFIAAVAVGCASIWLWDVGFPHLARPLHDNLSAVSRHPWTAQAVLRVAGMEMISFLADALLVVTVWAMTRIHRSHPRAVLLVFAAAVTAPYLPFLARFVIRAATDPRLTTPWVPVIMPFLWQALCILAAGLWVVRKPRFTGRGRLTHVVAILAASLCVLAGLAHGAGLVGELTYTLHEQYMFDVLNIGSVAYLVLLLWRPNPASRMTDPSTHVGDGPGAEAAKSG
jgi:hypothetical protein